MISIFWTNFLTFTLVDILGLYLGCYLVKKYIRKFPEQLIPIIAVISSVLLSFIWVQIRDVNHVMYFYLEIGIVHGLAVVGLNQLYKQTRKYILYRRALKVLKKVRKQKKVS